MSRHQLAALFATSLVVAACNPFRHEPSVTVSGRDSNIHWRWHATLATPDDLGGAARINGTASMMPAGQQGSTDVAVAVANATPGGRHAWRLHRGRCGTDEGVVGAARDYRPFMVDRAGRASATAMLPIETPTTGSYFVSVAASADDADAVVACGNLTRRLR